MPSLGSTAGCWTGPFRSYSRFWRSLKSVVQMWWGWGASHECGRLRKGIRALPSPSMLELLRTQPGNDDLRLKRPRAAPGSLLGRLTRTCWSLPSPSFALREMDMWPTVLLALSWVGSRSERQQLLSRRL